MTSTNTRPTRTHQLDVRGQKLSTRTARRYVAVGVRPEPVINNDGSGTLVAYARVVKRSDSQDTARRAALRNEPGRGAVTVVVDLDTGTEVYSPAPARTTGQTLARSLKPGEWIERDGRVERVVRVSPGPSGYVVVRTDHCDRTLAVLAVVERVPAPEATPTPRALTIHGPNLYDQSKGDFRVHDAACSDNQREVRRNGSDQPLTVELTSADAVVDLLYADQLAEGSDRAACMNTIYFAPCCAGFPIRDEDAR
jgi:hypothetical protein